MLSDLGVEAALARRRLPAARSAAQQARRGRLMAEQTPTMSEA